jgi:tRNA/tmRNA/rRNA uracil-C5-methylase (TrmA/RlmC/RlmD family)
MEKRLSDNPACNSHCRACQYKNLGYREQLVRKTHWATQQLGPWKDVLQPITPARETERLAYRSKSWMKSRFRNENLSFGMTRSHLVEGSWEEEFVSWDSCPIHVKPIQLMIEKLRPGLVQAAHDFARRSLVGLWFGSPHLVIISRNDDAADFDSIKNLDWSRILEAPFDQVWFHSNSQVGKKIFGHREIKKVAGSASPPEAPPIRAFRQVAQSLLVEARDLAVGALLTSEPDFILDLYCGTGDLALVLPKSTGWIGIELAQEAARYAGQLRSEGLHAAYVGTVEHRLKDPKVRAQIKGAGRYALYINPPRSGMSPEAREEVRKLLQDNPPQTVAYLSCSASSLRRDLPYFENEGYRVESLKPYDFFPQTEHFETLALLSKPNRL